MNYSTLEEAWGVKSFSASTKPLILTNRGPLHAAHHKQKPAQPKQVPPPPTPIPDEATKIREYLEAWCDRHGFQSLHALLPASYHRAYTAAQPQPLAFEFDMSLDNALKLLLMGMFLIIIVDFMLRR